MHIHAPLLCHVVNVSSRLLTHTLLCKNPRGIHTPFLNQKGRNMNCSDVCSGMRLKTHSREMGFCWASEAFCSPMSHPATSWTHPCMKAVPPFVRRSLLGQPSRHCTRHGTIEDDGC